MSRPVDWRKASARLRAVVILWFGGKHGYVARFARAVNVSPGNAGDWFSEKREKLPGSRALVRIEEALLVDPTWLMTGTVDVPVCERVRSARLKAGLEVYELAEMVAVPCDFVEAVEACRIMPSREFLRRAGAACGADEHQNAACSPATIPPELWPIIDLLKGDPDAVPYVEEILRSRRASREAERSLRPPNCPHEGR